MGGGGYPLNRKNTLSSFDSLPKHLTISDKNIAILPCSPGSIDLKEMTDIFVMLFQVHWTWNYLENHPEKNRNRLSWKYIAEIEHLKFFWQTPCVHQIIHNQLSCLCLKTPLFDTQAEQQKESRALLIERIKSFFKCIYKVYTCLWWKILNIW